MPNRQKQLTKNQEKKIRLLDDSDISISSTDFKIIVLTRKINDKIKNFTNKLVCIKMNQIKILGKEVE